MTTAIWVRHNRYVRTIKRHRINWIFVLVLSIILISFIYLTLSVKNIQIGYQISEALELQKELIETNHALKLEWSQLTSPRVLSRKARVFGLVPPQEIIKIK